MNKENGSAVAEAVKIPLGHELSCHFEAGSFVLLDGQAAVFGAPVRRNVKYQVEGRGVPIVAFSPCRVFIEGNYTSKLKVYDSKVAQLHQFMMEQRRTAQAQDRPGPRIIVVGEMDTGKSSICRSLVNMTAQLDGLAVSFTDVDIGQTAITVPGTISTAFVEGCLPIDDEFTQLMPLVFYHGDKTVTMASKDRYLDICSYTMQCVKSVAQQRPEYKYGGHIINTMGWVTGLGYDLICSMIDIFSVTDIIVTGSNSELMETIAGDIGKMGKDISLHEIRRSDSLYKRTRGTRITARTAQVLSYFTGTLRTVLTPCRIVVALKDVLLLSATTFEPMPLKDAQSLLRHVAAVSNANSIETVPSANVAGFVLILEIGHSTIQLLAPSPGPLPHNILLVSPTIIVAAPDIPRV